MVCSNSSEKRWNLCGGHIQRIFGMDPLMISSTDLNTRVIFLGVAKLNFQPLSFSVFRGGWVVRGNVWVCVCVPCPCEV